MLDFDQIQTQGDFGAHSILQAQENSVISNIEKLLEQIGFRYSDLVCSKGALDVLQSGMGSVDSTYHIVPYYVFLKIFTAYGDHLLNFYDEEDINVEVRESFKKYINKLKEDLSYYDSINYDYSSFPKLNEYDEIITKTSYAVDPSLNWKQQSNGNTFTQTCKALPTFEALKTYPFDLIYPIISEKPYFYLYHNITRLAICSLNMEDISLFNEDAFSSVTTGISETGLAYNNYVSKFFDLLNKPKMFVRNNKIVKNIVLDFCTSNQDMSKIKMIIEQSFLKESFHYYCSEIQDVNGLEFYDFYLTDRMEQIPVVFKVNLSNPQGTPNDHYGGYSDYPEHISFTTLFNYCKWLKSIMHFTNLNICFFKNPQDFVSIPDGELKTKNILAETEDINIINEAIEEKINNALGMHCCISNYTNGFCG